MSPAESPIYSATTIDHFRNPRNVGRLSDANGFGEVDDRETENLVSIYLRIERGIITAARFRTLGCSACIAASSMATVLVQNRPLARAADITAERILEALGGLPPGKHHCPQLAARALAAAVRNFTETTAPR